MIWLFFYVINNKIRAINNISSFTSSEYKKKMRQINRTSSKKSSRPNSSRKGSSLEEFFFLLLSEAVLLERFVVAEVCIGMFEGALIGTTCSGSSCCPFLLSIGCPLPLMMFYKKGITWVVKGKRWKKRIRHDGNHHHLCSKLLISFPYLTILHIVLPSIA